MVTTADRLGSIELIAQNQGSAYVTHNEGVEDLANFIFGGIAFQSAPPGSPNEGDSYLIKPTATGDWAGFNNNIVLFQNGGWVFKAPQINWRFWIGEDVLYRYDGVNWVLLTLSSSGSGSGGSGEQVLLDSYLVTNPGVENTITFDNIPQTYRNLVVRFQARDDSGFTGIEDVNIQLNSDNNDNNYYREHDYSQDGTPTGFASDGAAFSRGVGYAVRGAGFADSYSTTELRIFNYTATDKIKVIQGRTSVLHSTNTGIDGNRFTIWDDTSSITRIDLVLQGAAFLELGSDFLLYGEEFVPAVSFVSDNLVNYWKMEEASGNPRLDSVGSDDLAEFGGSSGTRTGRNNLAIDLTGGTTGLQVASGFSFPTADFSVSLWIKFDTVAADQYVFSQWAVSNQSVQLRLDTTGSAHFECETSVDGTAIVSLVSSKTLVANFWYHVVFVFSGNDTGQEAKLYVNRTDLTTAPQTGIFNSTAAFNVGLDSAGANAVDGPLDEVGIYDSALTIDEITSLYNRGLGTFLP